MREEFFRNRLRKYETDLNFKGQLWCFHRKTKGFPSCFFVVALHDTAHGRLAGGVQYGVLGQGHEWLTFSSAVSHITRKADNMHEKIILHGLHNRHDIDGLKVGIVCNHELSPQERADTFASLGRLAVEISQVSGKKCLLAGDSRVSASDLLLAWKEAPDYILGRPHKGYGGVDETGPPTAKGVAQTVDIANRILWRDSLERSVAIKGLGSVGMPVLREMLMRGWHTMFADTDLSRCIEAIETFKISSTCITSSELIHSTECSVFVPCALYPVIRSDTIGLFSPALRIIVSAQNDEIDRAHADELVRNLLVRGIELFPGPLSNSVGIQILAAEFSLAQKTYEEVLSEELNLHRAVVESVATQARDENRSVYSVVYERIRAQSES